MLYKIKKILYKILPHKHVYRLGDYSGKRCGKCGRFRKDWN